MTSPCTGRRGEGGKHTKTERGETTEAAIQMGETLGERHNSKQSITNRRGTGQGRFRNPGTKRRGLHQLKKANVKTREKVPGEGGIQKKSRETHVKG